MSTAYLGLGSNMGDRLAKLQAAVDGIAALPFTRVLGKAGVYETPPFGGPPGQGDYLNTVCRVETTLTPWNLLKETQRLECELGREPESERRRWGSRMIDIDILLWDDLITNRPLPGQPLLEVPHPRMAERAFVLLPLAELAPDLVHPAEGKTIRELLERIGSEHEGIRRLPL